MATRTNFFIMEVDVGLLTVTQIEENADLSL